MKMLGCGKAKEYELPDNMTPLEDAWGQLIRHVTWYIRKTY